MADALGVREMAAFLIQLLQGPIKPQQKMIVLL